MLPFAPPTVKFDFRYSICNILEQASRKDKVQEMLTFGNIESIVHTLLLPGVKLFTPCSNLNLRCEQVSTKYYSFY